MKQESLAHQNKKNVCLGPNFKYQVRFTQVFWANEYNNDFWFYDGKKDEWVFFNDTTDSFHMYGGEMPGNIDSLKEIGMEVFEAVRSKMARESANQREMMETLKRTPFHLPQTNVGDQVERDVRWIG